MASEDKYLGVEQLEVKGYTLDDLAKFLETKDFADLKECTPDNVRNGARSGAIVAFKLFGKVLIDPNDPQNEAWEAGEGGGGRRREDGRKRQYVYLDDAETAALKDWMAGQGIPADCFVEKAASKPRAKKVAEAVEDPGLDAGDNAQDAFASFGA